MKAVLKKVVTFLRQETVLVAAIILAVVSMCIVPPDRAYADYIDWETICLLFSLMAVMKGFQRAGLFSFLAGKLLKKANTSLKVCAVLVFLPFVLSMLITNDVALITFVPFGLIVLKRAGLQKLSIHVVVLQTIAANLGSMMTPMGNPQNLYLYNISGMSFGELMLTMLPYGALAAVMLTGSLFLTRSEAVTEVGTDEKLGNAFRLGWPAVAFVLAVLSLFNLIPSPILAACMLVFLLIADRDSLKKVDYSLLITFIALFIFIGNIGRIPEFRSFLSGILEGRVTIMGVALSQIISNVPAALLLTGFTSEWKEILIGVNLGGLGTLIASMASLISYKAIAKEYPNAKGKYILRFTVFNVAFLGVLIGLYYLIAAL